MGEIFRAKDQLSGREVAVKVLLEQRLDDRVRFAREAAVLSELRHPGIVERIAAFLGEIVDTPFPDEESVLLRTARQNAQLMSDQLRKGSRICTGATCPR